MSKAYSAGSIDYHLLKRKSKAGKPIYYVGFLSDLIGLNGRRRYRALRSTGVGNVALARKRAADMIEKGEVFAAKSGLREYLLSFWDPTVSEYLRGKNAEGRGVSVAYVRNSLALVKRYVLPYFEARGITRLSEITRPILLGWRNFLYEKRGLGDDARRISPRTINAARQSLFVPLQHAVDMGELPYHPGQGVRPVREHPEARQIFQLGEYQRLFTVEWPDIRYRTACLLAACTGMRMGEVRGLLVKNVHLGEGYLDVITSWQDMEGSKPPKWGSERFGLQLPEAVVKAMGDLLAIHRWGAKPDAFVFFSIESAQAPISKHGIERAMQLATQAAGLPSGRTFHSFRHSLVSHASSNLSQAALQGFIGHTNAETTGRYQHVTDADRAAMREIQAKILPFKKAL